MQKPRVSNGRLGIRRVAAVAALVLFVALGWILPARTEPLRAQQPSSSPPPLLPGPPPSPQDRVAALQDEAERLARESRTILGELRRLEVERAIQNERARQAAAAVREASSALEHATERLSQIESDRAVRLPDVRARLVDLYKRGRTGNLRLLLGASSVRDFARTTRAVRSMASLTEARLAEYRQLLAEAQAERAARVDALARLQSERQKVEQTQAAAASAVAARSALLADIDRRRDLTAQLAGELQVAARRLDEQVTVVATTPPEPSPIAPVFPPRLPVRGGLEWPLDGRVVGRFGDPSTRTAGAPPRNGIEIAAAEDTPARAIHPGSVVFASTLAGFGTLVIVDHSRGYHSVYGYLGSTTLTKGDVVDVGREVGRVGRTPGGPAALYFEFRIDGRSVDPIQWLRQR